MTTTYERWYDSEKERKANLLYEKLHKLATNKEILFEEEAKIDPALKQEMDAVKTPDDVFKFLRKRVAPPLKDFLGVTDTEASGKKVIDATTRIFTKKPEESVFPYLVSSFGAYANFLIDANKYFAKEFTWNKIKSGATADSLKGGWKEYKKEADWGFFPRQAKQSWVDLKGWLRRKFNEGKEEEALLLIKEMLENDKNHDQEAIFLLNEFLLLQESEPATATLAAAIGAWAVCILKIIAAIFSIGVTYMGIRAMYPWYAAATEAGEAAHRGVATKEAQDAIETGFVETSKGIGGLGKGLGRVGKGLEGVGGAAENIGKSAENLSQSLVDITATISDLTGEGRKWIQKKLPQDPAEAQKKAARIQDCDSFRREFSVLQFDPDMEYDKRSVIEITPDSGVSADPGFYAFKKNGKLTKIRNYNGCRRVARNSPVESSEDDEFA